MAVQPPQKSAFPIPGQMGDETVGAYPIVTQDDWDILWLNPTGPGRTAVPGHTKITGSRKRKTHNKSGPGTDGGNTTDQGYQPAEFDVTFTFYTGDQLTTYFDNGVRGMLFPKPYKPPPTFAFVSVLVSTPLQPTALSVQDGGALTVGSFVPDNAGIGNPNDAIPNDATGVAGTQTFGQINTGYLQSTASPTAPTLVPVQVLHPALYAMGIHAIYFIEEGAPEHANGIVTVKLKAREFLKPGTTNITSTAAGASNIASLATPTQPIPQPPSVTDTGPGPTPF